MININIEYIKNELKKVVFSKGGIEKLQNYKQYKKIPPTDLSVAFIIYSSHKPLHSIVKTRETFKISKLLNFKKDSKLNLYKRQYMNEMSYLYFIPLSEVLNENNRYY